MNRTDFGLEKESSMTVQTVTVQLPIRLYNQLKHQAERAHRSVEDEVMEVVTGALPADDELSTDLQQAMRRLAASNDETLWQTATARFPQEKSVKLESLHLRRQTGDWAESLARESAALASEMEEFIYLRAYAMSLLVQRGHDPTELVAG